MSMCEGVCVHTYAYSPSRCCSPLCEESAQYTLDDSMGVLRVKHRTQCKSLLQVLTTGSPTTWRAHIYVQQQNTICRSFNWKCN